MKNTGAHEKHFGKPPTWLQARRARGAAAAPCDADAWGQQDSLFVEADAYVLFAARPETRAESRAVHRTDPTRIGSFCASQRATTENDRMAE